MTEHASLESTRAMNSQEAGSLTTPGPLAGSAGPDHTTPAAWADWLLSTIGPTTLYPGPDHELTTNAEGTQYWEVPFLVTVCVLGVLGNLIVVAVYSKTTFRRSNAAIYVLNLATGDLFLLVVVVGLHITEYYPSTWPYLWRYDIQCILHRYGRFVGFNVTIFTMVAIAIDRYVAVCHPIVFRAKCTPYRTKICVVSLWVLAALTAAPTSINFGVKYQVGSYNVNFAGKTPFACRAIFIGSFYLNFKIIYVSVILFWLPVLVTAAAYIFIVVYVWCNNRKFQQRGSVASQHSRGHWKAARILLTIFCVYVLSYVFLATYTLVRGYATVDVSPLIKNVGLLFPYVNSCLNPVVYSVVNLSFRRACVEIFWPRKPNNRDTERRAPVGEGGSPTGTATTATLSPTTSSNDEIRMNGKLQNIEEEAREGLDNQAFEGNEINGASTGLDSAL